VFSNEFGVFYQCHENFGEIKKFDEIFVISYQNKKVRLQSLQALPGLTLTISAIGAGVDRQ
jgi:hypothetical protein